MNRSFFPIEVLEPLSIEGTINPQTQDTVVCDTGYRCVTGKVTY